MADYVTSARPHSVPVFAFTNDSKTRRRLALNRSVYACLSVFSKDPEKTLHNALNKLKKMLGLESTDKVVVISDVLADSPSDAIQIRSVG